MAIRIRAQYRPPSGRVVLASRSDGFLDGDRHRRDESSDEIPPQIDPPPPRIAKFDKPTKYDPAESSPRKLDPVPRQRWLGVVSPEKRNIALILSYVEGRLTCKDKAEAAACRAWVKAWNGIAANGNPMGIGLAVNWIGSRRVAFWFHVGGSRVQWLPVLSLESTPKTAHLLRECGPCQLVFEDRVVSRPGGADHDDQGRRAIPPKVEAIFSRGKPR